MQEQETRRLDPLLVFVQDYRRTIMQKLWDDGVSQAIIANAFGVSRQSVYALIHMGRENHAATLHDDEPRT